MIDKFLSAKHWQLFTITFGVFIVFYIYMITQMVGAIDQSNPDPLAIFDSMKFMPFVSLIYMLVLFGWFWSVGKGMQDYIPPDLKMKTGKLMIALVFPMLYFVLFMYFVFGLFSQISDMQLSQTQRPDEEFLQMIKYFGLIMPFHLISMFCVVYTMYFVSKSIKLAEVKERVKFVDHVGEFFLVWFFPIGIWFLQPRINKLYEMDDDGTGLEQHLID